MLSAPRVAQEAGEYGEAILLCVECFQGVDTLQHLSVGAWQQAMQRAILQVAHYTLPCSTAPGRPFVLQLAASCSLSVLPARCCMTACLKVLRPCGTTQVSHELKMTVQRLYIETISRLDMALQNVCANFVPEEYGKVRGSHPATYLHMYGTPHAAPCTQPPCAVPSSDTCTTHRLSEGC